MTEPEPAFVFESVGAGRGFEKIVTTLRGAVARGDLVTGQRLPSEPDLATQLGVSRPMLREALKALEVSGVLEVRRGYGGGRFVAQPRADEFHAVSAAPLSTLDVEPHHVLDVRLAIEPMAARLAAQNGDAKDLSRALRKLGLAGTRPAAVVEGTVGFHLALIEAAANPVFEAVFHSLRAPIAIAVGAKVGDPTWRAASRDRLTHLMRLVEDGEADAAERAARRYLLEYEDDRGSVAAAQ